MVTTRWTNPVRLGFTQGGMQTVSGPFEALIYLTEKWPNMRGLHFMRARSACRAALAGRKTPEEAREIFIEAAHEAELKAQ